MDHLAQLLAGATATGTATGPDAARATLPTIVVTDSVFSMDGDVAPLDELVALCERHDALLVLDEAHAVLGPDLPAATGRDGGGGIGGRDRAGVQRRTVVRVGTLSKTLGSLGGFVAASRDIVDLMVNRARSYIFSTALTPADAAAALAALRILRSAEGAALVGRLAALIDRVTEAGLAPPGHPSPIIPVVLGSEQAALTASASLLQDGLWVPAIRPPTVPVGTSRLRVTLSAAHGDDDVDRLLRALVLLAASGRPPDVHGALTGVRPRRLVAVVGTGTEVGKTWVAARVLRDLRAAGLRVAARKPAQSFEPGDDPAARRRGGARSGERRAGRRRLPPAPLVRGRHGATDGRRGTGPSPVHHPDLVAELDWPAPAVDVGLVETAGGVRSPLAADGDAVSLCHELTPDLLVLVADAGLGTINAVRLTTEALRGVGAPQVVVLNRFDASTRFSMRATAPGCARSTSARSRPSRTMRRSWQRSCVAEQGRGGPSPLGGTQPDVGMGPAAGPPSRGDDADGHATPALGAEAGWVERAGATGALAVGPAASGAVTLGCHRPRQMAAVRAPMGMRRSSSIWRSSSAERPSVVR